MPRLSIRGLDAKALAKLKERAAREDASVNTLVLRLIEQGLGHWRAKPALRRHDDLDALAVSWRNNEGLEFERAAAPFAEVDAQLWKWRVRRKGQPIPTIDLWIAASAQEHGAALLTRDGHFSQIDGFRRGQRLEDFLP